MNWFKYNQKLFSLTQEEIAYSGEKSYFSSLIYKFAGGEFGTQNNPYKCYSSHSNKTFMTMIELIKILCQYGKDIDIPKPMKKKVNIGDYRVDIIQSEDIYQFLTNIKLINELLILIVEYKLSEKIKSVIMSYIIVSEGINKMKPNEVRELFGIKQEFGKFDEAVIRHENKFVGSIKKKPIKELSVHEIYGSVLELINNPYSKDFEMALNQLVIELENNLYAFYQNELNEIVTSEAIIKGFERILKVDRYNNLMSSIRKRLDKFKRRKSGSKLSVRSDSNVRKIKYKRKNY